ncbi:MULTISPECIES: homing endonuclease associated repeat-containing protein [unclassified Microcoleus]|uniref:homing endonuclease associated repeat-containing protein n=1 Tax=unclassified Microcoleus TaxID=2642155 RepID=UPI002FD656F2
MQVTQDQLIKWFQEYYQSHGEVPALNKVRDKSIPCPVTHNTVVRKFGSWNNALKAAGLPLFFKPILAKEVVCFTCDKVFYKQRHRLQEGKPDFCSNSCAATYTNCHKNYGNRRSKLENWIEEQLLNLYPKIEIYFNRKDAINAELDIYIPSLNLAFELNGIFHYEPIYGIEKLASIQNNDSRKFQACLEKGIELAFINCSQQKKFQKSTSQKYLNIITSIINSKVSDGPRTR